MVSKAIAGGWPIVPPGASAYGAVIVASSVTVTLGVLTVSSSTGSIGTAGSWTISNRATGSVFSLSGSGAAGLTVDNVSGVISGTPTTAGVVNVTETLSGAVGSPMTTSNLITIAEVIPFLNDSSTYYWDFAADDNTLDTLGTTTLSKSRERVGNKLALVSQNKQLQPLNISGGINFNQQTARILMGDTGIQQATLTNGKPGWFFACTVTATTGNGYLLEIARNASQAPSRAQLYISSSRTIVLKMAMADGASLSIIFQSTALTLGSKYAIAVLVDLTSATASLWINGVSQTITVENLTTGNFPSTNPYSIGVGNTVQTGEASLDGVLNNVVFYDGVPSSTIRDSIIAFENTRRAA